MEKLIYILDRRPELTQDAFDAAMLDEVVPALKKTGGYRITVNLANRDAEMDSPKRRSPRIYGAWDKVAGAIHFWLDSIDTRSGAERALERVAGTMAGYLVTESIVQDCERGWSGRQRRPGVTQFALVQKPPKASEEHFYHHWQVIHSPWSFELHPERVSYVRNAVARNLTPGAAPWRGIVLEHFSLEAFVDESRYYASDEVVQRLWRDVAECVDLDSYTGGPMSEYHLD